MPNLPRFGVLGFVRSVAALACAASLTGGAWAAPSTKDVGYPDKADISVPEGYRTLHLELVPGLAMVRFESPEAVYDPAAVQAGRATLGQTTVVSMSSGEIGLVKASDGLAADLGAAGSNLADTLAGVPQVGFSGPVFKLAERLVGTGDTIVVQMDTTLSAAQQEDLLASLGLDPVRGNKIGFWVARVATDDGYDVINKAIEIQGTPGIESASVDWHSEYTLADHTDTFNGTSAAAPMAAGVAALVMSRNPELTSEEVIGIVKTTAVQPDPAAEWICAGDCAPICPNLPFALACYRGLPLGEVSSASEQICPCEIDTFVASPATRTLAGVWRIPALGPNASHLGFPAFNPTAVAVETETGLVYADARVITQDGVTVDGAYFLRCADGSCPDNDGECATCADGSARDPEMGCVRCAQDGRVPDPVWGCFRCPGEDRAPHPVWGCDRCGDGTIPDDQFGCDRCQNGDNSQLPLPSGDCREGETFVEIDPSILVTPVVDTVNGQSSAIFEYQASRSFYGDIPNTDEEAFFATRYFSTDVTPPLNFSQVVGTGIVNAYNAVLETPVDEKVVVADTRGGIPSFNDPLYPYQWHLNVGNQPDAREWADIDAAEAWSIVSPHPDLVVGVIDSGVATDNKDLNVIDGGFDPWNDSPRAPQPESANHHGTAVAGIIAARGNNGYGGVGVVPGADIAGVRFLPERSQLIPGSIITESFEYVVDQGAWVINNSWGVPHSNDYCDDSDDVPPQTPPYFALPFTLAEKAGVDYAVSQGRGGLGSVVVFAAGNDRADTAGYELLYRDCLAHELPRSEWWGTDYNPVSEGILSVAATNNLGERIWYSNYGMGVDVAAPSGDDRPDGLACADEIWTGGVLGIVTDDINIFELGGTNHDYPDSFTTLHETFGPAGFTGFYDWAALEDLWVEENSIEFRGRGAIIQTRSGSIEVYPNVIQGIDGILTGTARILVRDETDTVTQQTSNVVVTGRVAFKRSGVIGVNEKFNSKIAMKGTGTINGRRVTFTISGTERFNLVNGELFVDPITNISHRIGFNSKVSVNIAGAGSQSAKGRIYRSNVVTDFQEEPEYGIDCVQGAQLQPGIASIYSPTIDIMLGKTQMAGNASVDYRVGALVTGGTTKASFQYATPRQRGRINAAASNGLFRATSFGYHNADQAQPFAELIDITHFAKTMTFRTPASSVSIKNPREPEL